MTATTSAESPWWTPWRAVLRLLHLAGFLIGLSLRMRLGGFARLDPQSQHERVEAWSRQLLACLGVRLVVKGQLRPGSKLIVANHVSWMDIMAINSIQASRFVSKAEVGQWPIVGPLVTLAGTIYLERARRRDALRVVGVLTESLREGRTAAVFPEGTTGAGEVLLNFHGNLLQSAIDADVPIQPVALRYSDSRQAISPAAAYIGDTTLVQSLWWIACSHELTVTVSILSAQRVTHADRRALAHQLREDLASALDTGRR